MPVRSRGHAPCGRDVSELRVCLNERLIDNNLGSDVRQFTSLPCFHLLSHRLEGPLHSINANRDTVDQRERLRVFREHWHKLPRERHIRADEYAIPTRHRQTHALVGSFANRWRNGTLRSRFRGREPQGLSCRLASRVLVVDDTDVAKPERLDQGLHDLMVRDRAVRFVAAGVGTSANSSRPMVRPP